MRWTERWKTKNERKGTLLRGHFVLFIITAHSVCNYLWLLSIYFVQSQRCFLVSLFVLFHFTLVFHPYFFYFFVFFITHRNTKFNLKNNLFCTTHLLRGIVFYKCPVALERRYPVSSIINFAADNVRKKTTIKQQQQP